MKILKYRKTKANIYEIYLENGTVLKLYDDTIIKYSLLLKKALTIQEFEEINSYNDALVSYYLTLKYIAKKMRSKLEVEKHLQKAGFDNLVIEKTIKKIEDEGYLSNEKFTQSFINDQIHLTFNGPDKIKHSLIKLGINENEININYDFNAKIQKLIEKKIKSNRKYNTSRLKINLANYLIDLGYPREMFIHLLEDVKINDEKFIMRDYELLLKKYRHKYQEEKLNIFIRDKLYKKGYNIEEINEVMNCE